MKKISTRNSKLLMTLAMVLVCGMAMGQNPRGLYQPYPATTQRVIVGGDVFGGGKSADVAGKSSVLINHAGDSIGGSVYGGGALANVGTTWEDSTTVNILNGIVNGNVYGGGLGDSTAVGYGGDDDIAALVHGKVYVNIGQERGDPNPDFSFVKINGSVFGCNNINGTPLDSVFVNIYRTWHSTINLYPDTITDISMASMQKLRNAFTTANTDANYAIKAVYGGGNKASYKPIGENKTSTVHIYYCDENTIKTVYGGGNAANVGDTTEQGALIPAHTHLIIDGGRFDQVFGGGNGYSAANPPNHTNPSGSHYNPGANIFGSATTDINGGLYNQVFGGSNQYGNIASASLNINGTSGCVEMILESFCGGNEANMTGGDINATIANCDIRIGALYGGSNNADILKDGSDNGGNVTLNVLGGNFDYVFGGSKGTSADPADIAGDVTLNLHGGTISSAYGGSDVKGNILGNIAVYVLDTVTTCPLQVDTVYGAGRDAYYTPTNANAVSPLVKIQHAKIGHGTGNDAVPGCVFGGGKGSTATVTAHPKVIIGELATINDPQGNPINTVATVTGDVYGGGDAANVVGGTTVLVQKCNSSAKYVYGGGNAANVNSTKVYITGGTVDTLFGGGHGDNTLGQEVAANVTGNDTISITGGTVGKAFAGSNLNGTIGGRMALNIAKSNPATCDLKVGEAYGGGNQAAGKAGTITIGCTGTWTTSGEHNHTNHNSTDNRIGYELEGIGTVYGGGNMADIGTSENPSNIHLAIQNGIVENVFGGNNTSGDIYGTIQVDIDSVGDCSTNWYVGNVFGGGNHAAYSGTPDVNIINGTVTGSVYGGGNEAGVGGGDVAMTGGTVLTGLYGGCNTSGTVTGNINVSITGGTVGASGTGNEANVHGGGYGENTKTGGNVEVTINQQSGENPPAAPVIWGDVYGGSALGSVNSSATTPAVNNDAHTYVTLTKGTVHGDIYGGGLGQTSPSPIEAKVWSPVQVTVNGGTVTGSVYGCNNANGAPQSTVKVDIYGTDTPATGYALGNVFGGGNQAAYANVPEVKVHNCNNSIEYVYGGGNAATVAGTDVTVYGGNSIAHVFGGCYGADVTTSGTDVKIYGGTIDTIYGGNNESGTITGDIKVLVDKLPEHTDDSCAIHIKEVYGGGNKAASHAGQISIGYTGYDPGERINYVYGGANRADVTGPINLTIREGRIDNVFGGNNNSGNIIGDIIVNIERDKDSVAAVWYVGNVFGGGNQATYGTGGSNYPQVNILNGLVSNDVFGGGLGSTGDAGKVTGNPRVTVNGAGAAVNGGVYGGGSLAPTQGNPLVTQTLGATAKVFGGGKAASVTGAPTVAISGGMVSTGVYGGCDSQGNVSGDITVTVSGGTIGSTITGPDYTTADVFGGGYGENTSTTGNVEVNINGGTIYGDVYGGSALGNVNTENGNNTTTVNINGGTLETTPTTETTTTTGQQYYIYHGGNVYGGGLGYYVDNQHDSIAAMVYGPVTVNIGSATGWTSNHLYTTATSGNATIKGNVYGCNNTFGSPQDDVTVNVFQTYMPADTAYSATYLENDGVHGEPKYVLANVFGGGNRADFQVTGKTASVNIYSCDNTIYRTFGGSNAAASNTVSTMIQGGRVLEAFAGGNGEVSPANINGNVTLAIHGGYIGQSFGGSNQQGTISNGTSSVTVDGAGGCGDPVVEEYFCGGNFADYYGDIDATIECADGMHIKSLYGGCKQADVLPSGNQIGNVHLVVKGGIYDYIYGGSQGKIDPSNPENNISADISGNILLEIHGGTVNKAVFGGSHILGTVAGTITVNVEDQYPDDGCPLDLSITDIYGGGNQANYPGEGISHTGEYNYPQVNIKNATVKNVFGGGLEAEVVGNPQIRIKKGAKVLGNVYGGGNMGVMDGNPKVIINGKDESANPTWE